MYHLEALTDLLEETGIEFQGKDIRADKGDYIKPAFDQHREI
jgi:hypothetical protein